MVRLTDRPDMTIAVYRGRKTTTTLLSVNKVTVCLSVTLRNFTISVKVEMSDLHCGCFEFYKAVTFLFFSFLKKNKQKKKK